MNHTSLTWGLPKQPRQATGDAQKRDVEQLKARIRDFGARWDVKSVQQHGSTSSAEARASASKALLALATHLSATPRAYPRTEIRHVMQQEVQWPLLLPHLLSTPSDSPAHRPAHSDSPSSCTAAALILLARCLPGLVPQQATAAALCALLDSSCHPPTSGELKLPGAKVCVAADALLALLPQWTFTLFWSDWQGVGTSGHVLAALTTWLPAPVAVTPRTSHHTTSRPVHHTIQQVDASKVAAAVSVIKLISKVLAISSSSLQDLVAVHSLSATRWLTCLVGWLQQSCQGADSAVNPDLAGHVAALLELMSSYLPAVRLQPLDTLAFLMSQAHDFVSRATEWLQMQRPYTDSDCGSLQMQIAVSHTLHFLACQQFWCCCHVSAPADSKLPVTQCLSGIASGASVTSGAAATCTSSTVGGPQVAASKALVQHMQYLVQAAGTVEGVDDVAAGATAYGVQACRTAVVHLCCTILGAATPQSAYGDGVSSGTSAVCHGIQWAADQLLSDASTANTLLQLLMQAHAGLTAPRPAHVMKVEAEVQTRLSPLHGPAAAGRAHGITSLRIQRLLRLLLTSSAHTVNLEGLSKVAATHPHSSWLAILPALCCSSAGRSAFKSACGLLQQQSVAIWRAVQSHAREAGMLSFAAVLQSLEAQDVLHVPAATSQLVHSVFTCLRDSFRQLRCEQVAPGPVQRSSGQLMDAQLMMRMTTIQAMLAALTLVCGAHDVQDISFTCQASRDHAQPHVPSAAEVHQSPSRPLGFTSQVLVMVAAACVELLRGVLHCTAANVSKQSLHVHQMMCLYTCLACVLRLLSGLPPGSISASDWEAQLCSLTNHSSSQGTTCEQHETSQECDVKLAHSSSLAQLLQQLVHNWSCSCLVPRSHWQFPPCPIHHHSFTSAEDDASHHHHAKPVLDDLAGMQQQLGGELSCLAAAVLSRLYGQLGVPNQHLQLPWSEMPGNKTATAGAHADNAGRFNVQLMLKGSSQGVQTYDFVLSASPVLAAKVAAAQTTTQHSDTDAVIIQLSAGVPYDVLTSITRFLHTGTCHVAGALQGGRPAPAADRELLLKVARSLGLSHLAALAKARVPLPGHMLLASQAAPCLIPTCGYLASAGSAIKGLALEPGSPCSRVSDTPGVADPAHCPADRGNAMPGGWLHQGPGCVVKHEQNGGGTAQHHMEEREVQHPHVEQLLMRSMEWYELQDGNWGGDMTVPPSVLPLCADLLLAVPPWNVRNLSGDGVVATSSGTGEACLIGVHRAVLASSSSPVLQAACSARWHAAHRRGHAGVAGGAGPQTACLPVVKLPEVLDADVARVLIAYAYTGSLHVHSAPHQPDLDKLRRVCCPACAALRLCLRVAHCAQALMMDGLQELCNRGVHDLLSKTSRVSCVLTLMRDAALLDLGWALMPCLDQLACNHKGKVQTAGGGQGEMDIKQLTEWLDLPAGLQAALVALHQR